MARIRLVWHIFPPFLLLTLFALLALGWFMTTTLHDFYLAQKRNDLSVESQLVKMQIVPMLEDGDFSELDQRCKALGKASGVRFTVILPSGKVVGDSDEDISIMDNHLSRPEVIKAIESGRGDNVRFSDTLGKRMLYVAYAQKEDDQLKSIIRLSLSISDIDQTVDETIERILIFGFVIVIIVAGMGLWISRRISVPIDQMRLGAHRFAKGELNVRVGGASPVELDALAESLNEMARQLQKRLHMVTEQRNEREAILSSMIEGVIAVDLSAKIMSVNHAAAELLRLDSGQVVGHSVQESIRNSELQKFVEETLSNEEPHESNIRFSDEEDRYFQLHGVGLSDSYGKRCGAVIVLNDITQLQRLENMRREFVANVSHELKTPITSIKGFVELLQDGGGNDPEQTERFLSIISRQTDRLNAIIEDLLTLSSLDNDREMTRISRSEEKIISILKSSVEVSHIKAEGKNITVKMECDEELKAMINSALLEQAVVNLVDNAIKYSPEGSEVTVRGEKRGDEIVIEVEDKGCGIQEKHHGRLFERFYVVDKARSRKLGGTGLGLAIVKHIASVNGGCVTVHSEVNKGSCFTIHLPAE